MDLRKHCDKLSKPTTALNAFLIDVLTTIKMKAPSAPIIDKLYKLFPSQNATLSSKDKADFLIKAFKEDNEPMSIADLMKHISEQELKKFITEKKTTKIGGRYTKKTRRRTQKGGFVEFVVKKAKAFLCGAVAAAVAMPVFVIASNISAQLSVSTLEYIMGLEAPQLMPLLLDNPEVATVVWITGSVVAGIGMMFESN